MASHPGPSTQGASKRKVTEGNGGSRNLGTEEAGGAPSESETRGRSGASIFTSVPAPPASSSAPAPCPTGLGCLARRAGGPTLHSEGHVFVGHACRVAGCADVAASVDGEDLPDLQGACGWSGARRRVRGPGDRDGASWALTRPHPGIPGPGPSACLLPVCKQRGGTWVLGRPCSPPRA